MEYMNFFGGWSTPGFMAGFGGLLFLFIIWSLIWKGLALWHAARRGEKGWFIALLIINTAGILEIIYLLVVAKINQDPGTRSSGTPNNPPKS